MLARIVFCAVIALGIVSTPLAHASLFGEENIPLMKLVLGQVMELERLAAALEVAKDQRDLLAQVNAGVTRTISQIEAIEEILTRAQGLNPGNIRRISELTQAILEVKDLKRRAQEVLTVRLAIADNAVAQSGLQAETAYTMGQEMIRAGSTLSRESAVASPGRAAQITASAASAQALSTGVMLQTMAHIAQLQAVTLDLQKSQIESGLAESQTRSAYLRAQLVAQGRSR